MKNDWIKYFRLIIWIQQKHGLALETCFKSNTMWKINNKLKSQTVCLSVFIGPTTTTAIRTEWLANSDSFMFVMEYGKAG